MEDATGSHESVTSAKCARGYLWGGRGFQVACNRRQQRWRVTVTMAECCVPRIILRALAASEDRQLHKFRCLTLPLSSNATFINLSRY